MRDSKLLKVVKNLLLSKVAHLQFWYFLIRQKIFFNWSFYSNELIVEGNFEFKWNLSTTSTFLLSIPCLNSKLFFSNWRIGTRFLALLWDLLNPYTNLFESSSVAFSTSRWLNLSSGLSLTSGISLARHWRFSSTLTSRATWRASSDCPTATTPTSSSEAGTSSSTSNSWIRTQSQFCCLFHQQRR